MSFKIEWVKRGSRVLTRNGPGMLVSFGGLGGEVELDKAWAGSKFLYFSDPEEMTLESEFTLVRIVNLTNFAPTLVMNAQNYPSWEECLCAMEEPYSSNETLLALNFRERMFASNRKLESEDPYQILLAGLSVYRQSLEVKFYSSFEEAREAWQEDIDAICGTSGDILLCALLDLENKKILAKAIFATTHVVSRETFW